MFWWTLYSIVADTLIGLPIIPLVCFSLSFHASSLRGGRRWCFGGAICAVMACANAITQGSYVVVMHVYAFMAK